MLCTYTDVWLGVVGKYLRDMVVIFHPIITTSLVHTQTTLTRTTNGRHDCMSLTRPLSVHITQRSPWHQDAPEFVFQPSVPADASRTHSNGRTSGSHSHAHSKTHAHRKKHTGERPSHGGTNGHAHAHAQSVAAPARKVYKVDAVNVSGECRWPH